LTYVTAGLKRIARIMNRIWWISHRWLYGIFNGAGDLSGFKLFDTVLTPNYLVATTSVGTVTVSVT
jgi:hypothetical protein